MGRFEIKKGKRVPLVGVNSNTKKYHYLSCRYYVDADIIMPENKAVSGGNVCGACCVKEN